MQAFWTLLRRELGGHFVAWHGYVVIALVQFLIGLSYVGLLAALNSEPITTSIPEMFFETNYFWLILLMVAPLITMRTFAMEKALGTFETLMTAPITDFQVVMAKFFGSVIFYVLMWVPLLACILVFRHYAQEPMALDPAKLGSAFLGIFLLGLLYMSMGCLASALSRSQISAAMIGYALCFSLFMLSFLSYALPPQNGIASRLLYHINQLEHMKDFARGVIDTRQVVFYLSATFLFLHLTLKTVESRRWK